MLHRRQCYLSVSFSIHCHSRKIELCLMEWCWFGWKSGYLTTAPSVLGLRMGSQNRGDNGDSWEPGPHQGASVRERWEVVAPESSYGLKTLFSVVSSQWEYPVSQSGLSVYTNDWELGPGVDISVWLNQRGELSSRDARLARRRGSVLQEDKDSQMLALWFSFVRIY